jgi:TolB protein
LENVDFTTGFAWSPDGGQIVYGARGPDSTDLYVIDWNGSRPVNLTNNPGGGYANQEYRSLVWSPDGKQIAFLSNYPMQPGVYLINADGTGLRRVIGDFDSAYVGLSWWNPS